MTKPATAVAQSTAWLPKGGDLKHDHVQVRDGSARHGVAVLIVNVCLSSAHRRSFAFSVYVNDPKLSPAD